MSDNSTQYSRLALVQDAYLVVIKFRFPVLLSIVGRNLNYNHIVVWYKMIIDFKAKTTKPFTVMRLKYISGMESYFLHVSNGNGIIPSKAKKTKYGQTRDWGECKIHKKRANCNAILKPNN